MALATGATYAAYASLAIGAASAGYGVYSQERAASEAAKARNQKPPELPKQAKVASFTTDQQKAQALAMSAGGTIFSDQKANRGTLGSGPATGGKTLLGA